MSISSFNEFTNKKIESIYNICFRSWGWATWEKNGDVSRFLKKLKFQHLQLYNLLPEELEFIETAEIIKSCQLNLLDAWDYN